MPGKDTLLNLARCTPAANPSHLHVAQHARQLLLHQLEGRQRRAKLVALTQVAAAAGSADTGSDTQKHSSETRSRR
jgi:hypothetical protein